MSKLDDLRQQKYARAAAIETDPKRRAYLQSVADMSKSDDRLVLDLLTGRWRANGYDLHCGDCFLLCVEGKDYEVRIEIANGGWYLVGLPKHWRDSVEVYAGCATRSALGL